MIVAADGSQRERDRAAGAVTRAALTRGRETIPIIAMLVTLTGGYGFTGGGPVIQGFRTVAACEAAIPAVRTFYGSVEKIQCLSLPSH